MNRLLLLLLLPLGLVGCATGPAVPLHVDVTDISRSDSAAVRDARPTLEGKKEIMSYLVTSDAYGILREGDLNTEPSVMRLIQHRVFERAGPGAHATVHHLVLYRNMQPQLKAGALGAILGPIGAAIAVSQYNGTVATSATLVERGQFDALTGDNEWKRASYASSENPDKVPVIVSYLDLDVDGRRAFVRVVSPLQVADGKNPFLLSVEATIQEALRQLPDRPAAAVSASAAAPVPASPPTATVVTARAGQRHPSNALHLERALIDGKTLSYPHPRDEARYGDVRLAFAGDVVAARNARSGSAGHYTLDDDQLCMTFESAGWTPYCVYLLQDDSVDGGALRVMFTRDGQTRPATMH